MTQDNINVLKNCASGVDWGSTELAYTPEAEAAVFELIKDLYETGPIDNDELKRRRGYLLEIDEQIAGMDNWDAVCYIHTHWDLFRQKSITFRYLAILGTALNEYWA